MNTYLVVSLFQHNVFPSFTNMVRLADEAERRLGKPVIAINAAIYWYALRQNGLSDRIKGFGGLLARF